MKSNRSINFGSVGLGQGGGRIAIETKNLFQYPCVVINSAVSDLDGLELNPKMKLHLDYGLDGAGKNLILGKRAIEENRGKILDFFRLRIDHDVEFILICVGGGGGTGSGGLISLIDIVKELGRPICVIYTLPLDSEDTTTKQNCIITLRNLSAQKDVSPIIIVDNEKISKKHPDLSITNFWPRANKEIIYTFHLFNMISSKSSSLHSFDMADYQMILHAEGCMVMGKADITGFRHKEDLAEKAKMAISNGLFVEGFDLTTAKRVGIILRGTKKALRHLKATDLDYMFNYIRDVIEAGSIYRGVYSIDGDNGRIEIYSIFGGLDFPRERLGHLIDETKREMEIVTKKKRTRLELDSSFENDPLFDESEEDDQLMDFIKKKTSKKKDGFWK